MNLILDFRKLNSSEARLINEIAEKIRNDYIDFLSKIGKNNENNIDWWMIDFVSRNTLVSDLFYNLCKLGFFKEKIKYDFIYKKIIVDSIGLKTVIEDYCNKNEYSCNIIYKGKSSFWIYIKRILSYFKSCMHFFLSWVFAWSTRHYQKKNIMDKGITLIDTFVLKDSFKNSIYNDRYYGRLLEYLEKDEKRYFYYVPTYCGIRNYRKLFINMRTSKQKFLLKEDYLKIKDYLFALLYPFRVRKLKIKIKNFMEFNIYSLIKEEIMKDSVSGSSMQGLLNYRFTKRLKDRNIKIRMILNWFENQTIDHGFNFGFRKYYPKVCLIGYQGFPLSNNRLSLYATEQELSCKVIPKEVKVIGKGYVKLAKKFCSDLKVTAAPALRFDRVWNKRKVYPEQDKFIILISLPILMKEAEELIEIALEVAKTIKINNCFFQIKPHPVQDIKKIKVKWKEKLTQKFEFVQGDFNLCVEKSNILISCISSTCLETLAKGIPVIVITSKFGLIQLDIPKDIKQDIWRLCYETQEVCDAIIYYANRDVDTIKKHEEIGRKIRENYFEPVTRESVRKFLRLQ